MNYFRFAAVAALLALAACVGQIYYDDDLNYQPSFHPPEVVLGGS